MRTVLFGLAWCAAGLAGSRKDMQVVVPPCAAHPQDWLRPHIQNNPNSIYQGKSAGSLAEFVVPDVISKIVVDQYAGPPDDVRRYLTALPTAAARYFGPSLELCKAGKGSPTGAALAWTSTSTITFESGRSGRLAVATVFVSRIPGPPPAFVPDQAPPVSGWTKYRSIVFM